MKKKWFIIFGIIIIIILGFFLLRNSNQKICGLQDLGSKYSPEYCDKSCESEESCKFDCGCGAININENCEIGLTLFDCVDHEVNCENNICNLGEEKSF